MTIEENTESTALALNDQNALDDLKKEVLNEFITSDREVYKEGLRSLLIQEQKLLKQVEEINGEIADLQTVRDALDVAFKAGELKSVEDARGIVRSVREY